MGKHGEPLKEGFLHITSIHVPLATALPSDLTTRQVVKWSLAQEEIETGLMDSQLVSATVNFQNNHVTPTAVIGEYSR